MNNWKEIVGGIASLFAVTGGIWAAYIRLVSG
jgi:hypothetical protein